MTNPEKISLTFLGAAGTVTGSKYLIEVDDKKILIDCGLFQGLKELRSLNWQEPSFDPSTIDAVLLTHGHLDHTGYLPRLVQLGFRGKIWGTDPTLKITEIILKDSAKIQEEEAERANREKYSKHEPALPFYDLNDVERTLQLFTTAPREQWIPISTDNKINARFNYNGHILGSAFIELKIHQKTLVFSGDLGREKDLLLYPPQKPEVADLLLIESTYGGRYHPEEIEILPKLEKIVNQTIAQKGTLLIPSFAVERAQLLMYLLWQLIKAKRIPVIPMILDTPMGANLLNLFHQTREWHRLAAAECDPMCASFKIVSSFRETLEIRKSKTPKIVIAGSGMLTGGRILNYLETYAGDAKSALLFVGYQAIGTRGRKLLEGSREIKIYGKTYPVHLKSHQLEGLSAHADQNDLLNWLSHLKSKPGKIFIVHGEKDQAQALQKKLKSEKGWHADIAQLNQKIEC